ncbi:glycosyltransferase [Crenalkalicoccus roseus]|uniref:glycosyltransferase n=1 Tax=Crenalkalicoccus roseus TaxID=1485588 RepID=UPI00130541BE|nr:glycosyltransferase [Crenalkalicoccus roseus]
MTARDALTAFTPLPPARNGIADYAALLLGALTAHYDCAAACEDWLAEAPPGVAVLDPALAHRRIAPGGRVLHQLGNNPQHGFVLQALRRHPGVTTLHDPGLLHLHEAAGEGVERILAGMAGATPALAPFARHLRDHGLCTRANHLLFDLAGEVLARSRAVVVHSRFALGRLRALHGEARTGHVAVVPHPLPAAAMPERAAARARLGIAEEDVLVVTAGFATAAKRLDWVIEALERALAAGAALRWVHAGAERPEEFPLSARIAGREALRPCARVTGWLPQAALDEHIAAADALLCLRFPSFGESSGALARGLAAGTCCLVSDTGAYAELPREAVLHIPLAGAVPALAAALAALARERALARRIGAAGREFAAREMALPAVAAAYREVIEASRERPVVAPPPAGAAPLLVLEAGPALRPAEVEAALAPHAGPCRLLLAVPDLAALAALTLDRPGLVPALLPPWAALRRLRVQAPPAQPGLLLELDLPWRG